jgi:hypothetical protein
MNRLKILYQVCHTSADREIIRTGHDFYVWAKKGTQAGWDKQMRPQPENITFEIPAIKFDLMVTASLEMIREHGGSDIPVIFRSIMDFGTPRVPKEAVDASDVVLFAFKESAIRHAMDTHPKARVIEPGMDTEFFSGWRGDGKPVLSVAHAASRPFKGGYMLAQIHGKVPVSLCGVWNEKHPSFDGWAKNWDELLERYRSARVYFNPCSSFTLSAMEAMAVGMPLVTMPTSNFLDVLQDGANCLIAWNQDHAIEQIDRLLKDRKLSERIGAAARATIQHRTAAPLCQDRWNRLFQEVIAAKKPSP